MSPALDQKDDPMDKSGNSTQRSLMGEAAKSSLPVTAITASTVSEHGESNVSAREVPVSSEISYSVAIYPYMAEQEDEFDVIV